MKISKSNKIIIALLLYGITMSLIQFYLPDAPLSLDKNPGIVLLNVIVIALLLFIGIFFKIEEKSLNSKEISFIAIYSAFTAAMRIPFVPIPGVQPCSYLIFVAGYVFGPLVGFVVGGNVALLSNIILGHGPWTVYQIYGWGLFGVFGGLLSKYYEKRKKEINKWLMSFIGLAFGFIYGWLLNSWYYVMSIRPLSFSGFILFNVTSVFFDLTHGIANVIFFFYFGERTIKILQRYRQRFAIIIVQTPEPLNVEK